MGPRFVPLLTPTVIPGTPPRREEERGEFEVPDVPQLLRELRTGPLSGRLPRDRDAILEVIDGALEGRVPLRPD